MLLLSFFVLAAAEQGDVTFDGTLGSCVLSAGSDAGTIGVTCPMQYDDNIAFHPARGETSDIFFVRGENTCSISMGDSASPTLLFDCPITVGVAAPIDCGADQSDRKACLKLTSDSHTCTIAMGSTSEELITDCIFGSGATVEAISSVVPTHTTPTPNTKCVGSDRIFDQSSGFNLDTCKAQCEATANCKAYAFKASDGYCMNCAQDGTPTQTQEGFSMYSMPVNMHELITHTTPTPNTKCVGSDRIFDQSSGFTLDTCKVQCEATANCKAYAFKNSDGYCMNCAQDGTPTQTQEGFSMYSMTSSDTAPAPCPACCSGFEASWATTQMSNFETVTAADSAVLMSFADDQVCGGEATSHQHMTATATITLENDSQFDLLWSGVGEAQYETLTITVNGVVKETFQALADGSCQMGSCTMCNTLEQTTSLNMLAGTNTIEVVADSIDGQYHQGAYFAVRFRKAACTEDCSVCGSR